MVWGCIYFCTSTSVFYYILFIYSTFIYLEKLRNNCQDEERKRENAESNMEATNATSASTIKDSALLVADRRQLGGER